MSEKQQAEPIYKRYKLVLQQKSKNLHHLQS